MCGILGWIHPQFTDSVAAKAAIQAALTQLARRGPDGQRSEAGNGWVLGHTRLAILDLTDRAIQPMTDRQGHWLVFNGEIYNFRELRDELIASGLSFTSTGDAEVLLKALSHWGVACLPRLRGMFAFGWLDEHKHELILARDRFGVKPLVYETRNGELRFASDLFALRSLPGCSTDVDDEAVYLYLALGYVPAPYSILQHVRKVQPGCYLRVQWNTNGIADICQNRYWSISEVAPAAESSTDGDATALQEYEARLSAAVNYRLISDVPVGSLLSGGIDSTLVTAMCREQPAANIPSFTMGFEDPAFDESSYARAVATVLGGQHREFLTKASQVMETWSGQSEVYDEPFADSSSLPTVLLCRQIVRYVKVALCGDGGDEVFCGYQWHRSLDFIENLSWVPFLLRQVLGRTMSFGPANRRFQGMVVGERDRVSQWSALRTGVNEVSAKWLPVTGAAKRAPLTEYFREWSHPLAFVTDPLDWACRMDMLVYLPDDLQVKTDRASMSVGLELREPMLDHELVRWGLEQPLRRRYDREKHKTKVLPRQALAQRMNRSLFERPKQGFQSPIEGWLSGPLKPAADTLLAQLKRGELAPLALPPGCRRWEDCADVLNDRHQHFLWRVLCFADWLQYHRKHFPSRQMVV